MRPNALPASRVELDATDRDDLIRLVGAIEAHDNPPFRTSPDEIERWFTSPNPVAIAGWCLEGTLVAYATVRLRAADRSVATCLGGIAPQWRGQGIGEACTQWQTQQATRMLGEGGGSIVTHVEETDAHFEDHLTRLGYTREETFYDMARATDPVPGAPALAGSLAIVAWDNELSDLVRRAFNRMNAGFGATTLDTESWNDTIGDILPEASLVCLDRSSDRSLVAGFLIASVFTQDWDVIGARQGTIAMYGRDADYAGQGIVRALITESVRRFGQVGLDAVGVSASASEPGTCRLLDDLGFTVTSASHSYVLQVAGSA